MNMIDRLLAQVKPALDEFRQNPSSNPNYRTMMRVRERILAEDAKSKIFNRLPTVNAGRCALAMQIDVSSHDDVEKAAEFLFTGFMLMVTLVNELCGQADDEALISVCKRLELKC